MMDSLAAKTRLMDGAPQHPSGRIASQADEWLLTLLCELPGLGAQALGRIRSWWMEYSKHAESLTAFLVRKRVLASSAAKLLEKAPEGRLRGANPRFLLQRGGLAILQQEAGACDPSETPSANKTAGDFIVRDALAPGSTLGRCLLFARIGEGAFGSVFRAYHQTLGIPVAVKILLRGQGETTTRDHEVLAAEARLLAQMAHPALVRILDFDNVGPYPHLVLELVDGMSLEDLIFQSGRLDAVRAARLLLPMCDAIDALAKFGIVHRDIKPANILVGRDGSVKLADLGLGVRTACLRKRAGETKVADAGLGTPLYISPEQVAGRAELDRRSDLYSLGVSLYEALVGEAPFEGGSAREIALRHCLENAVPPAARHDDIPPEISAIVMKLLSKRPEDRFASGRELRRALEAFIGRHETN